MRKGGHTMSGEDLMYRMVRDLKAGKNIEQVVDRYCKCRTPQLRQQLIAGIRQIVGKDMIQKAMRI
jgi:hypothetical protein